MDAVRSKLIISAAVIIVMIAGVGLIGTTSAEDDPVEGMMIDFGYWDVSWIEMKFQEGMDGYDALRAACAIAGYKVVFREGGSISSINGQSNLENISWGMYVTGDGGKWVAAEPKEIDASDHRLLCFSRSTGADTAMPGTDGTGFSYYDYARDGMSASTGEPLRIVTLAPSVTETICAVGGFQYIIGTDLYSNYPQEIVDGRSDGTIAVTGGYTDPNYEYIVRLAPDIVFCDGGAGEHLSMADKLRKSGVNCVVLYNCTDVNTLYNNMWIAASALGLSENANSVINNIRHTIDAVSGIAGMTNKRVFSALSADPSPWTSGSNTFMSDIIALSGGRNVFDSQSSSWFMVSKEQIYKKQPRVIIVMSTKEVTTEERYQEILDSLDPLWKQTPAYENGDVYVFSGKAADIFVRPGPRLSEATELLCKCLNGEAFTAKDPLDSIPRYFGDDYAVYLSYQTEVFR